MTTITRIQKLAMTTLASAALAAVASQAHAQAFPAKPVRVVLTSQAGNVTDANTRMLANALGNVWGQSVVVENRVGANGAVGTQYVIAQPADGHTLLATTTSVVQNLALRKKLPYDIFKDLTPISQVFIVRIHFAIAGNIAANSMTEFINLARANPSKYSFGSFGVGSTAHMLVDKINLDHKTNILHVPFQGSPAAINALIGGQIHSTLGDWFLLKQYADKGQVKILASTGGKRSPYSPNIPTFTEAGIPGFNTDNWAAWFAPAGTPEAVLEKIAADIRKVQGQADVQAGYAKQGIEAASTTPAEMRRILRDDHTYWNNLVDAIGMKAE